MRSVSRARWLADFDMESLVERLLSLGMVVSIGFLVVAMVVQWFAKGQIGPWENLQGTNLLQFMRPVPGASFLVHLGIGALLLTPYLRVLVSMLYFAWVDRNVKYALFSGLVLFALTYILILD